MNIQGNLASGFVCPKCGSRDKQEVIWLDMGLDARLRCAACEYCWTTRTSG